MRVALSSIALSAFLLTSTSAVSSTLRLVGLPKAGNGKEVQQLVAGLALRMGPGDQTYIYDARAHKRLASIAIPDTPEYARLERRIELLAAPMRALKAFTDAMAPAQGDDPNIVDASAFFDELGPTIADHNGQDVRVLVMGAPWFTAPGSLARQEYRGTWPSDGLILSDRSKSPFGTEGRHDLSNAKVDYCYLGKADTFPTPENEERMGRAWSLLIERRGGSLTTFSGDTKSCLERYAARTAPEGKQYTIDQTDARVMSMYKAVDVAPTIMQAAPIKSSQPPAPPPANTMRADAEKFDRTARATPPATTKGTAWIGIQWKDPIDLDLYVRCKPTSPFLYYGHQLTDEGRHNFDYTAGTGNAFETVNLTTVCDDITKASVFVNFYSGVVGSSPKGRVAIEFDGGIYKADFDMPATVGNNGYGLNMAGNMSGPQWVRVDIAKMLKLRTQAAN